MDKFKGLIVDVDVNNVPNDVKMVLENMGITAELPYAVISNVVKREVTKYDVTLTTDDESVKPYTINGVYVKPCSIEGINDVRLNKEIESLSREERVMGLEPLPAKIYRVAEYINDNDKRKDVTKELYTLYSEIRMGHITEEAMARRISAYLTNLANSLLTL